MQTTTINNGTIIIALKDIMDKKKISRTYLSRMTGIKYDIVNNYYSDNIKMLHKHNLEKICNFLECDISDIIKFIKK